MWLGPAPMRPFNRNRFGVDPNAFSYFRWFWDYAGGMMTDWGVHWLDIVQMAFDEAMPRSIAGMGGKLWFTDNRETPDTLQVTYEYPGFVAVYENRSANGQSMFNKGGGILLLRQPGDAVRGPRRLPRDTRGQRRAANGSEVHLQRQREPLGQLPGMRAHPRAARQRYREVFPLDLHVPAGQRSAAQPRAPGLGRARIDRRAGRRRAAS